MKRASQESFFSTHRRSLREFIPPVKGHPKKARPFSSRVPMHLVLRSTQARGAHSLLRHQRAVSRLLARQAARFFVTIKSTAICGNHIHCLLRAPHREALANFLRAIAGLIARAVGWNRDIASLDSNAEAKAAPGHGRFWDTRPYSRLVAPGRDEFTVRNYVAINKLEAEGHSRETARRQVYESFQGARRHSEMG